MVQNDYNERLFNKGIRSRLHLARFFWLRKAINQNDIQARSVLELGCFDGKTINFLPEKPERYLGFDANWEGGLDLAKETWKNETGYAFIVCNKPEDIESDSNFDISICMETLEHLPPSSVDSYLKKLAALTKKYSFMTFPNEKGLLFAGKHLAKIIFDLSPEPYTLAEFFYASIGRQDKIERNEHKGFDYHEMIHSISNYFEVIHVTALPFEWLPHFLGFDICVVARPKNIIR